MNKESTVPSAGVLGKCKGCLVEAPHKNEKNPKCNPEDKFFKMYDTLKKVDVNNEKNTGSL